MQHQHYLKIWNLSNLWRDEKRIRAEKKETRIFELQKQIGLIDKQVLSNKSLQCKNNSRAYLSNSKAPQQQQGLLQQSHLSALSKLKGKNLRGLRLLNRLNRREGPEKFGHDLPLFYQKSRNRLVAQWKSWEHISTSMHKHNKVNMMQNKEEFEIIRIFPLTWMKCLHGIAWYSLSCCLLFALFSTSFFPLKTSSSHTYHSSNYPISITVGECSHIAFTYCLFKYLKTNTLFGLFIFYSLCYPHQFPSFHHPRSPQQVFRCSNCQVTWWEPPKINVSIYCILLLSLATWHVQSVSMYSNYVYMHTLSLHLCLSHYSSISTFWF